MRSTVLIICVRCSNPVNDNGYRLLYDGVYQGLICQLHGLEVMQANMDLPQDAPRRYTLELFKEPQ